MESSLARALMKERRRSEGAHPFACHLKKISLAGCSGLLQPYQPLIFSFGGKPLNETVAMDSLQQCTGIECSDLVAVRKVVRLRVTREGINAEVQGRCPGSKLLWESRD